MKDKPTKTIHDIHSYILFANIKNEDGTITGHRMVLEEWQIEAIEEIVVNGKIKVMEEPNYELEDEDERD